MKKTVIDILIYLFENYMDDEIDLDVDRERLKSELRDIGFDSAQVSKAFDWLQDLASSAETDLDLPATAGAVRIFTPEETLKLDTKCRGLIYFLEQIGVLDANSRETVIERVMALDAEDIDLEHVKWIVLMILFNQPGHEQAYFWIEDLVMDELGGSLH